MSKEERVYEALVKRRDEILERNNGFDVDVVSLVSNEDLKIFVGLVPLENEFILGEEFKNKIQRNKEWIFECVKELGEQDKDALKHLDSYPDLTEENL